MDCRGVRRSWITLIESGVEERCFETPPRGLAAFAMIEMGMGVSLWFVRMVSNTQEPVDRTGQRRT